jgi:hypothetical protein
MPGVIASLLSLLTARAGSRPRNWTYAGLSLILAGCTSPEAILKSETTVVFRRGMLPLAVTSGLLLAAEGSPRLSMFGRGYPRTESATRI